MYIHLGLVLVNLSCTWKVFPSLSKRSWATESGKPSGNSDLNATMSHFEQLIYNVHGVELWWLKLCSCIKPIRMAECGRQEWGLLGKAVPKQSIDGKSKNSPTCKLSKANVKYNSSSMILVWTRFAWTHRIRQWFDLWIWLILDIFNCGHW